MKTSFYKICLVCWGLMMNPAMASFKPLIKTPPVKNNVYKNNKNTQRKSISSAQAANIVKSTYGGKILKVKSTSSGYRVKVLKNDGRISSVFVDGTTGRIKG